MKIRTDRQRETGIIGDIEKLEITIVDYDPAWPEKFRQHASTISIALGNAALRIEHIGSTSVSRLAAKPIIDILVVVQDSSDEDQYLPQLHAAGYQLRVREPDWHEHRMFRTAERDVHIHVFSVGSSEIERHLTFRDRLRTNADDRLFYEQTKRKLAAQSWPAMDAYARAKTDVIDCILSAARQAGEITR
ncbi:MAG: GrpB family protein [Acidobacteria bacterium]|nr:GrpB family protein [Acidobacteriota bacterium]